MITLPLFGVLFALHSATGAARAAAVKPATPPVSVNIVHHKLKRGTTAAYQALEANIVSAYERAKMPLYWLTFQAAKDPRDVLYLNVFNTPEGFEQASESFRTLSPAHPELIRLSTRLTAMVEAQTSVLTTRRDEIAYTRSDVDFRNLHALVLATYRIKPGHEGKFMDALRKAAGAGAPWLVYESNTDPTFVVIAPLKSRSEARHAVSLAGPLRALRGSYRETREVYVLVPAISRRPTLASSSRQASRP